MLILLAAMANQGGANSLGNLSGPLKAVATVVLWYLCNITVSLSNRYLLTNGLRAPISLTCLHMLVTFSFSNFAIAFLGFSKETIQSSKQFWKVVAQSITFGVSIVCGISALGYIPVSFNEMISSTTSLFTAVIAYLLQGEAQTPEKCVALLMVAVGACISSKGEPSFELIGFMLALIATASRALKSVLQAVLLNNTEEKMSSMNLLRYMTSIVFVILVPVAMMHEGPTKMFDIFQDNYSKGNVTFFVIMALNASAAFMSNFSQFLVTKCVGAVVLQVLGNFKGVINACISVAIFHNPVTLQSIGGYSMTTAGVFTYTYLKQAAKAAAEREKDQFLYTRSPGSAPPSPQQPLLSKV